MFPIKSSHDGVNFIDGVGSIGVDGAGQRWVVCDATIYLKTKDACCMRSVTFRRIAVHPIRQKQ